MTHRRSLVAIGIVVLAIGLLAPAGAAETTADEALGVAPNGGQPDTTLSVDGDTLTLHPQPGQTVSGTTNLGPGQSVTVRLRSSGSNPFIRSAETTADADGAFSVTFDLSDVEAPATATASVYAGGDQVAGPVEVAIVAEPTATATTTDEPTATPGQPGFGAGIALVGLLVGLLARRR